MKSHFYFGCSNFGGESRIRGRREDRSFITDRTQQVAYQGRVSSVYPVQHGVPEGSVPGPEFCVLYTAQLDLVVAKHGLRLHQYADDNQIDVSVPPRDIDAAIKSFASCLTDVEA